MHDLPLRQAGDGARILFPADWSPADPEGSSVGASTGEGRALPTWRFQAPQWTELLWEEDRGRAALSHSPQPSHALTGPWGWTGVAWASFLLQMSRQAPPAAFPH